MFLSGKGVPAGGVVTAPIGVPHTFSIVQLSSPQRTNRNLGTNPAFS